MDSGTPWGRFTKAGAWRIRSALPRGTQPPRQGQRSAVPSWQGADDEARTIDPMSRTPRRPSAISHVEESTGNPSTALPMGAGAPAPTLGFSPRCSTSAPITCSYWLMLTAREDSPWSEHLQPGKNSEPRLPGWPAVGAGVCPPGLAAAFGSTKTGQSGAVLF